MASSLMSPFPEAATISEMKRQNMWGSIEGSGSRPDFDNCFIIFPSSLMKDEMADPVVKLLGWC